MGWNTWKSWTRPRWEVAPSFNSGVDFSPCSKSMDSPLSQPFLQPGSLPGGGEAFPGNPSCSSHEEIPNSTSNPSANSWKNRWKTREIDSFPWQQLLIVSFHGFSAFPGVIFPLNPAFLAPLCPCTSRVGKNSPVQTWNSIPKGMSRRSPSLPKIPVSLGKRLLLEFSSRSIFLLYPCAHPLPEARERELVAIPRLLIPG